MKTKFLLSIKQFLLVLMVPIIATVSCSTSDTLDDVSTAAFKDGVNDSAKKVETAADQLKYLTNKTRQYQNFHVAEAQGFEFLVYMPNMGDHFVLQERWDDTFNYLEPELLIYILNDEGEREFVGVEYLVFGSNDTPPEGFIGSEDVWANLGGGLWALHAWVGLENPDGVFHSTNSNVTY